MTAPRSAFRGHRPLALVNLAALDLRRRPNHRAELRSQLLMGELALCLASDRSRQWTRVENQTDGYRGWVRSWGLIPVTMGEALEWRRAARLRVSVLYAEIYATRGGRRLVSPVFLNTLLTALPTASRAGRSWRRVGLPDGRRGWIAAGAVESSRRSPPPLDRQVDAFLGIPYLWGGRTAMGFDCSGFVQQLLAARGKSVPRDADDQFRATRPLRSGDRGRRGDLIFFGPRRGRMTHVGIQISPTCFAHARGSVRVSSIQPGNPLYDRSLELTIRARGRLVRK